MEIFGVVNASPDSLAGFSIVSDQHQGEQYGAQLVAEGADHLDIGAQAVSYTHLTLPTKA